jgi:hypothetical protein
MPRFAQFLAGIVVVGICNGCWFDAVYTSGQVTCSDGICPSGLTCQNDVCVTPRIDAHPPDTVSIDAPSDGKNPAALTCADPGTFISDATVTGTTTGRTNTVSSLCNGTVMNGADAVYKIAGTLGEQLTLTPASADFPVTAYLIAPCTVSPATPACIDNTYATSTTPIAITIPATTDYFIIVDGGNAALSGAYSLTIAIH